MTRFVMTGIRLVGGSGPEHIAEVRWLNTVYGTAGTASINQVADFIDRQGNDVWIGSDDGWQLLTVIRSADGKPRLATRSSANESEQLLGLPRF